MIMRLVTGISLIERGILRLWSGPPMHLAVLSVVTTVAGILLLVGLWTPLAGTLVAVVELGKVFLNVEDPWIYILLARRQAPQRRARLASHRLNLLSNVECLTEKRLIGVA